MCNESTSTCIETTCIETTVNRPIDITFPLIEPSPTENERQNVFSGHNKD